MNTFVQFWADHAMYGMEGRRSPYAYVSPSSSIELLFDWSFKVRDDVVPHETTMDGAGIAEAEGAIVISCPGPAKHVSPRINKKIMATILTIEQIFTFIVRC